MPSTLYSKDQTSKLTLEITDWEFPTIKTGIDSEWLLISFSFTNSIFQAKLTNKPGITIAEIKGLSKSISDLLETTEGSFEFAPIEPYFKFAATLQKQGTARIVGEMYDVDHGTSKLSFNFESDQTCLRNFNKELTGQISLLSRRE